MTDISKVKYIRSQLYTIHKSSLRGLQGTFTWSTCQLYVVHGRGLQVSHSSLSIFQWSTIGQVMSFTLKLDLVYKSPLRHIKGSLMSCTSHITIHTSFRVPTQIAFSNSLCFPCPTATFPCANLLDVTITHTKLTWQAYPALKKNWEFLASNSEIFFTFRIREFKT